jgi:DNA-binding LacI/PurR family transcriptional regulator
VPTKEAHGHIASTSALARHLGLSRWTISRVLNGHPEVKPETSRRVREAMEALGFVPSPLGRALRGSRTGVVGVCFQALGSPIVARKIATLQTILRTAGFRALFEVTDGNPALELEVIRHFLAMKVDGMVLVGGMTDANAARITSLLEHRSVPAVLVDPMRRFALPTVELDREHGMRLALEHLLDLGHAHFALLGIDEAVAYGRVRWSGIRKVVVERELSWEAQFTPLSESGEPELDFGYGRRLAERFLQLPQRPTAILALNDQIAIGAMTRLQQAGLAVPGDLSIVGFDNLDVSAHVNPRLTTIDQHVQQLMETAVALLTEHTDRRPTTEDTHRAIHPLLVHRETTGPSPRR